MRDDFSKLIAAFGEARLREHLREQRVLHVAGADVSNLLSFDDLSAALAQGVFPADRLRVVVGRQRVDGERVGLVRDGQIVVPVLDQLARQGATVAVNGTDRFLPGPWAFCREGEALLGERLTAAVFVSFGPDSGLAPHTDPYDVIVVQLAGSKHWHFHGEPAPVGYPPRGVSGTAGPVTQSELLRAGDTMVVPAGLYHHCNAEGASMHLSIIWRRRHGAALAQRLFEQAAGDAALALPIEALAGEDAVAAHLAASKARLIEAIQAFDAAALRELPGSEMARPEIQPPGPDMAGPRLANAFRG